MAGRKKIPYGIASYKTIREQDYYYVDKTRFIQELESAGKFLFLIRPRRFGKSSFLTVLECYYDFSRKDEFPFFFDGTDIGKKPTPEKNSYLILKFNFSQVNPALEKMESSFQGHAKNVFFFFGMRYRDLLGEDYFAMMESHREAHQKLEFLLNYTGTKGLKVYVLIDEYDNFANTILSAEGMDKYHEITHGAGFFRSFFNILKGAGDQADSGLGRMFITGVSPLAMDDVTSGFNIGRNISLLPQFNEMLGFTPEDVEDILAYYGFGVEDFHGATRLMGQWYDNYRFSAESKRSVFNTDMVLYFMLNYLETGMPPGNMIDQNVRIDYVKLRHLLLLDRRLNGNFGYLAKIVETQKTSPAVVAESFPAERLLKPSNFISLLFFFGLLSHSGEGELRVPNLTVKKLMYEYLREGYEDADVFSLDFYKLGRLVRDMACDGAWEPVFRFLAEEVQRQTSIRDYLSGEKVVQTFLLAYLNATDYYVTRSEEEFGKGFADLYLEPFRTKCPDRNYAYLIEIKYAKRSEFTEEKKKKLLDDARAQLKRYAADRRLVEKSDKTKLKCVALVFSGWELAAAEECEA